MCNQKTVFNGRVGTRCKRWKDVYESGTYWNSGSKIEKRRASRFLRDDALSSGAVPFGAELSMRPAFVEMLKRNRCTGLFAGSFVNKILQSVGEIVGTRLDNSKDEGKLCKLDRSEQGFHLLIYSLNGPISRHWIRK